MGWLGNFFKSIGSADPMERFFEPSLRAPGIPGIGEPLDPDECYVELYLESLRLAKARKLATRFSGVVYSFVSLPRQGEENAQLAAVSKPAKLTELDQSAVDTVITVSKQIMGAVPWRGGPLGLELGLFSVKSENLLVPILDYVTKVSATAGISFVGAVKPFLPLLTGGMDLIAGQRKETALEVGIDTDISPAASAALAIIDLPKGSIDRSKLSLDPNDRKLLVDGRPLEAGYCVFSLRRTLQKADFGEIPELRDRYAAVQGAIRANRPNDAQDALTAFRLATIASADLITSDAKRLVERVTEKVTAAFPAGGISRAGGLRSVEDLSQIKLYT